MKAFSIAVLFGDLISGIKKVLYKVAPGLYKALAKIKKTYITREYKITTSDPLIEEDTSFFIEYRKNDKTHTAIKLIAFYLPQFHPFPENDRWWGKGFTEWTNVTKAKPNFKGHYQPHRPIHLGYYDLRVPEVMQEQAQLAKNYGVYGFSYYFYWFDGVVLMETPLRAMLNNKSIDMPFCLTWANENWTRRWTGDEQDVLIAQNYSETDAIALLQYMMDYFQDERYIRIDGKPIFIIYRPNDIPNIKQISHLWRKEAEKHGLPGLYLISVKFYNMTAPEDIGFDALVEFPPHKLNWTSAKNIEVTNREFSEIR